MRKLPIIISLLILFSFSSILQAQSLVNFGQKEIQKDPVSWKQSFKKTGNGEYTITFVATAEPKWHFYSQYTEGTMPMVFTFDKPNGYKPIGKVKESPKPKEEFDDLLGGLTKYWDKTANFSQKIKITQSELITVKGFIDYQACIEGACTALSYEFNIQIDASKDNIEVIPAETTNNIKDTATAQSAQKSTDSSANITEASQKALDQNDLKAQWYKPVIDQLQAYENNHSIADKSLLFIFIAGFLGGLIALVTPCVWPMIPMTVSYFIKQADKGKGKRNAVIYGFSIILIYVTLGLGVTLLFGADKLNEWSTSAAFNVFFFALLVVFAAAFLGAFELQLPTSWVNKMDAKADRTSGLLSIFFMAFTLALVSFSCTGPIIGTLLVEAVQNGALAPLVGMVGFSMALAIPFTLFAIFPTMMKAMPKSGGWLNSVKVVLGFLELALALKFLSNADLAYHWGILDRETFLVLWIVLFAMLGFYLLGKIRFNHDSPVDKIGVGRFGLASISFAFALYMVPGLWGAPLKAISAFSPPQFTQDFDLYGGAVHAKFENYDEGMAYAKANNKPVLVDFTGFGCVNCRNMEAAVWTDPRVKQYLEEEYVLISLYVDDRKLLPENQQYVSKINGKTIRNVGNKWSELQFGKFGTQSQPYYFLLDNEGNLLNGAEAYNLDVDNYLKFLKTGLENYKKQN